VNLLTFDDQRYLVSPRGQTQWVRADPRCGHWLVAGFPLFDNQQDCCH
jgi:hypothetical protein